jgi:hypothetical protein
MQPRHPDTDVIDALGGTVKTAALAEVSPQAVTQWRNTGIPKARRMYLQAVRPEVFADAGGGDDAQAAKVTHAA